MPEFSEIFSHFEAPPFLNLSQEIQEIKFLNGFEADIAKKPLPPTEEIMKLMERQQAEFEFPLQLPEMGAYAMEEYVLIRLLRIAENSADNLPRFISTHSAYAGGLMFMQDIDRTVSYNRDITNPLRAARRKEPDMIDYSRLLLEDPTGIALAEYIKQINLDNPYVAVPSSILSSPCFQKGSSMAADYFIRIVSQYKKLYGFK
jgi:hypothetical protein